LNAQDVATVASYLALKIYQQCTAYKNYPESSVRPALGAIAVAEVYKLIETRGLILIDKQRAASIAMKTVDELYDNHQHE
jgi:hypothetical protein